jgi:aryl-alcohol dehydrogenase-like predicted oxidoreductase
MNYTRAAREEACGVPEVCLAVNCSDDRRQRRALSWRPSCSTETLAEQASRSAGTGSAQQYGMGILAWGPLGQGMLTGRVRRGQDGDVTRARFFTAFSDERRLDAVEQLIPLAAEAGLSMLDQA